MNPIKKMRKESANISQKDLASRLNIDRTTVAKWETGAALPRANRLPELARALGCTIEDLLPQDRR